MHFKTIYIFLDASEGEYNVLTVVCLSVLTWLHSVLFLMGSLDTVTAAETCTPAWTISLVNNNTNKSF